MDYNNLLIYIAVSITIISFYIIAKNKIKSPKYIIAFKSFMTIICITGSMYIYKGKLGLVLGFIAAYISILNFDKNFKGRFLIEAIKIILIQMLIGISAYFASYNYISCVIISFIIIFIIYYIFTHKAKSSRARAFLFSYIILIKYNVPRSDYNQVFQTLFISSILAIVFYYIFTRKIYFKDNETMNAEFTHKKFKFSDIFEEEDREVEFKKNKFRYAIFSAILITGTVYYMKYCGNSKSDWIISALSAMLLIDPIVSKNMAIDRAIGTIIGAIVFVILSKFITNVIVIYILMAVSMFYTVFPMAYKKRMVFTTYFVLELYLLTSNYTMYYLVEQRVGFTIVASIIILLLVVINNNLKLQKNIKVNSIEI